MVAFIDGHRKDYGVEPICAVLPIAPSTDDEQKARTADLLVERPRDLVQRAFTAARPNQLWVSDFTYVATWRGFDHVQYATLEWVSWVNTQRLLEPLGYLPPAEYEQQFHRAHATLDIAGALN